MRNSSHKINFNAKGILDFLVDLFFLGVFVGLMGAVGWNLYTLGSILVVEAMSGVNAFFSDKDKRTITVTKEFNAKVEGESKQSQKAVIEQKTSGWHIQRYGRGYVIWDGLIIEEFNNVTGFSNYHTDYDLNVYDFDLGIIHHTTNGKGGGIYGTKFNDLMVDGVLPQHIFNVKAVGCELAEDYIERAESGEYGPAPEDVLHFHETHCELVQDTGSPLAP